MNGNARWVFFDVGGVLEDESHAVAAALAAAADALALSPSTLRAAFHAARPHAAGRSVIEVAIERFAHDDASRTRALAAARTAYTPALAPFPDAIPALVELREEGYQLGIVANQFPEALDRLDREALLDFFAILALPHLANARKPDPAIFRYAQGKSGARAEDCAMVGDRLDADVAPARACGWRGVWVARDGRTSSDADACVASLLDLSDALRKAWP